MESKEIYKILEETYFGDCPDEEVELSALEGLIADTEVFVDIGASLGQYTKLANGVLSRAEILAVEPDPVRFDRLSEAAARWEKLSSNSITCYPYAVAGDARNSEFIVTDSDVSGSLSPISGRTHDGRLIKVETRSIDKILEKIVGSGKKIFVKIDVEGSEYSALSSAKEIIAEPNISLFVELHPWGDAHDGTLPQDSLRLLAEAGFRFKKVGSHYLFSRHILGRESGSYALEIVRWYLYILLFRIRRLYASA